MLMLLALSGVLFGCGGKTGSSHQTAPIDAVRIDIDSGQADRLLAFYLGSYLGVEGGDPVAAGILEKREKTWYLRNPSSVSAAHPALKALYDRFQHANVLSSDTLEAFLDATYYQARQFPKTLDELSALHGQWTEPAWFRLDVQGSMVALPRRTWVRRSDIQQALEGMTSLQDPVVYPVGTLFVGEHVDEERVVETTFMRKRADGHWDFWVYDESGLLTDRVRKEPRDLIVPTRCTGCHFGDRAFEPERSFPGAARPGPAGPRGIDVPSAWRHSDLTAMLDEHARRSDTVLGLYATLYLAQAAAGQGDAAAEALLRSFGIESRTP